MKHLYLKYILLFVGLITINVNAVYALNERTIYVATAGTLSSYISDAEKYSIEKLTLTGNLNGTDFRLIRDMAGCNYRGDWTEGKLTVLDLSGTRFVAGGDYYYDTYPSSWRTQGRDFPVKAEELRNKQSKPYKLSPAYLSFKIETPDEVPLYLFNGCRLATIILPNNIQAIRGWAFYGCSSLASFSIPNSVTTIDECAFEGCSSLLSLSITANVSSIGHGAFRDCSSLSSLNVDSSNSSFSQNSGVLFSIDMTKLICYPAGKSDANYSVPNSVSTIEGYAFAGCGKLVSVSLGTNVKSIKFGAFCGCISLKSISVPNSVTSIESNTFADCSSLSEVTLPTTLKSIGYASFSGCSSLLSFTIPKSVNYIEDNTFYGCTNLSNIVIHDGVESIGRFAFSGCHNLRAINIPYGIITIEEGTFRDCGLTSISIPSSVSTIESWAFENCYISTMIIPEGVVSIGYGALFSSALQSLDIPKSLKTIDKDAFAYCYELETVYSHIEEPYQIDAFEGISTDAILYVPIGTKEKYLNTSGWNNSFYEIKEITNTQGIEVNATNFPDEAFRNWVLQNVSGASDGLLTDEEIGKITSINCSNKNISNLQGIEFFTALTTLNCSGNKLSSLDVSKNTALKKLSCQNNKLVSLDVSGCTAITEIECFSNQLTSLDVSKNTALTSLNCNSNQLASLDVSRNAALVNLYCGSNQLTSLDISNNTALKELNCQINSITNLSGLSADLALTLLICDRNQLKTLDVSRNTALTRLYCHTNQFTSLNVSRNTALTLLYCYNNQLTTLDLSKNTVLESLYCDDNQLSKLDVTNNTALKELSLDNNRLTSLDVSKNTSLTLLSCVNNLLTNLDVSKNTALSSLWCNNNQLTVLDVSRNTKLTRLDCYGNQLLCLNLGTNTSVNDASTSISPQSAALSAQNISEGIAIPVPSDFDYSKVSNLKLAGTSVTGSVATVNGQKYLVFAKTGTAESAINGKMLTYTYNTGNSFNKASSVDVTVTLSYTAVTYSLSIQSRNGGSVTYNGTTVKNTTQSFTVNEGVSATITITPDNGYRLASLTVNGTNVTSSVSNNQYTIDNITTNTTVVATFEEIPVTTFSLSIQSGTGGSVSYDGTTITNKTQSFTVAEGTSATITISPNTGYKLASLTVNGTDITSSVKDNQYTISNISANTTIVATFEQITYTLSVQATGNGSVAYNGTSAKNNTRNFEVNHGTSATLTITPDSGYRLASLTVNGTNVTSSVSNNRYTISNITANTTVVATFKALPQTISVDGINYEMRSAADYTLNVGKGNYGGHVVIPATISYDGDTWTVAGVVDGAFNLSAITAITWNPNTAIGNGAFGAQTNPNLLLYVKSEAYAPTNVQNVIANGRAKKIVLTDAASGNDFNCPEAFTAEEISYTHRYGMTTGIGECRGWETIALPFTVQKVMHQTKGQLVTFKQWDQSTSAKPYWLYKLTYTGFVEADFIEANTPYVISMPNHEKYFVDYILAGNVTFSAENATVKTSENMTMPTCNDKTFRPCFAKTAQSGVYAINAVNSWVTNTGGYKEGSVFVEGLRPVLPFEAYMTTNAANAKGIIPIFETQPTAIREIPMQGLCGKTGVKVYNLNGQLMLWSEGMTREEALKRLPTGIYIMNGKKITIK